MAWVRSQWRWLVVTLVVVGVDQASKAVATRSHWPIVVNHGVSFGWRAGLWGRPAAGWWLAGVVVLLGVVGLMGWGYWRRAPVVTGLFLGGAVANLIDRLIWGGVRDWLPIPFTGLLNNLADWAIAAAVVMLCARLMVERIWTATRHPVT